MIDDPRAFLTGLFDAAIAAADPEICIAANLPAPPKGRTVVVGAGKGAAQLARAFERHWPGALGGVIVTRYGYAVSCERIEVLDAVRGIVEQAGAKKYEVWIVGLELLDPRSEVDARFIQRILVAGPDGLANRLVGE